MTSLQDLVTSRLAELGLSYRAAAARSGGFVSHAHLSNIAKGRSGRIAADKLRGVALAIDVPLSVVEEAAFKGPDSDPEFRLPKKANKLTDRDRKAVLAIVNALLEKQSRQS
jgi:transcriptional regulator with XRE-family HTH domain